MVAIVGFLYLIVFGYGYNQINNKALNKKLIINKERIQQIIHEREKILPYLEKNSLVPQSYRNVHALSNFESYLITGRAETLKEAMNLYEQELRHEQQINEIRIMQQLQEATYKKADEAATIGWINLFTKR